MKNFKLILIILIPLVLVGFFLARIFFNDSDSNFSNENNLEEEYTIIAFGDSLTAGYGLPLYESYPAQLEDKLKAEGLNVKVINAGVSGETTKGNNERANFVKEQKPDMVILGIGGNDALRALPILEMKNNMKSTIEIIKNAETKPKIILLQIQSPLNAGFKYKSEFDQVYKDLAKEYDLPLVPFLVSSVFLNPDLMLEDRIHPNKEGYKKLVDEYVAPAVLKEIK